MKRSVNFSHTGRATKRDAMKHYAQVLSDLGLSEGEQKRQLIEMAIAMRRPSYRFLQEKCPNIFKWIQSHLDMPGVEIANLFRHEHSRTNDLLWRRILECAEYLKLKAGHEEISNQGEW